MNLIRFEPFTHRNRYMPDVFNDFFGRNIADFVGTDNLNTLPAVNISETEDAFVLDLAIPGMSKQDLKVVTEKNRLTISAEKTVDSGSDSGQLRRREFSYNTFTRSFILPASVDKDAVSATYTDGVLKLTLPKKAEIMQMEKSRVIDVA